MEFTLSNAGVGPLLLGVSRSEAREILEAWGDCRPFRRGVDANDGLVLTVASTHLFVYCDDEDCVNAIEFARPRTTEEGESRVLFGGIDLFANRADTVVRELRAAGLDIADEEGGLASTAYEVLLALWRNGDPVDAVTGLPIYFESALVARPGYYD